MNNVGRYHLLKARARAGEPLSIMERSFVESIEAIVGYEVQLHMPLGSKFVLGPDDAEAIVRRLNRK